MNIFNMSKDENITTVFSKNGVAICKILGAPTILEIGMIVDIPDGWFEGKVLNSRFDVVNNIWYVDVETTLDEEETTSFEIVEIDNEYTDTFIFKSDADEYKVIDMSITPSIGSIITFNNETYMIKEVEKIKITKYNIVTTYRMIKW